MKMSGTVKRAIPVSGILTILLFSLFHIVLEGVDVIQVISLALILLVSLVILLLLYYLYFADVLNKKNQEIMFWSFVLLGYIPSLFILDMNSYLLTLLLMTALITSMLNVRLGFITNFIILFLLMITKSIDPSVFLLYALGGSFICLTLPFAKTRQQVVYVAFSNFIAMMLFVIMREFIRIGSLSEISFANVLIGGFNGFIVIILTYGSEPLWETLFKITSAARLIELSNTSEPLLKRLLNEAPGTYHHSVVVANLAEKAAQDIHADYHLARVGALYHDIGKILHPDYFMENQKGYNIHDELSPDASAVYISNHVSDGMALAKEYKLPGSVKDIIEQHQGDAIISYFYAKAIEHSDGFDIDRSDFSYKGPKPQSKESAIVMLADCVEAAMKSFEADEKQLDSIQILVTRVTHTVFNTAQLDECPLLFSELKKIEDAFLKVYNGMYHERIKYEREM